MEHEYLIEKFKEKAPGTFKHCQSVASMIEAAAKALNLDVELMKTCAMFHDIGKTFNPSCFTENQDESNIHDTLIPNVSYQMITRHVSDSVLILAQHGFPSNVLKIISEHHGNTVLSAIYAKATNEKNGQQVNASHYRYKSLPPSSIESAVLMIVDAIEASSRSLSNNGSLKSSQQRKQLVSDIIEKLVDDEQLDAMKIGDLRMLKLILVSELDSIYHQRVQYEEIKDPGDQTIE